MLSRRAARRVQALLADPPHRVDPFNRDGVESALSGNSEIRMKVARVPLILALVSAAILVGSGYGARFGVWDYRFGFQLVRWSLYTGLATAVLALAALSIPRLRAGHVSALAAALVLGAGVAYFPWQWGQAARAVPAINDITTDTENPPAFVAVIPLRTGAPVPAAYPGSETAAKQRTAYPDIRPLELPLPPPAAFARALDAAKSAGWEIAAADAASGRIEATATTPWFGFRDDVVIRMTPTTAGSRIDIRSVSRVGKGDLGANAGRVRAYLAKVAHAQ
jgi:uncharacterized protein (DUF1499 family)